MNSTESFAAAALALVMEIGRFDFKDSRPGQGRDWRRLAQTIVLAQCGAGLAELRVKWSWEDLARLVPMPKNHCGEGCRWLAMQGVLMPIREDGGARIISVQVDSRQWKLTRLQSREDWLSNWNAVRSENGLEQLKFMPGDLSVNEPTLAEMGLEIGREQLVDVASNGFQQMARMNGNVPRRPEAIPNPGKVPNLGSEKPRFCGAAGGFGGSILNRSNEIEIGSINDRGTSRGMAADDPYIREKLMAAGQQGRRLFAELASNTTWSARKFQQFFEKNPARAREQIAWYLTKRNPGAAMNVDMSMRFDFVSQNETV